MRKWSYDGPDLHNKALKEAHKPYHKEGYQKFARFNDKAYAYHWF